MKSTFTLSSEIHVYHFKMWPSSSARVSIWFIGFVVISSFIYMITTNTLSSLIFYTPVAFVALLGVFIANMRLTATPLGLTYNLMGVELAGSWETLERAQLLHPLLIDGLVIRNPTWQGIPLPKGITRTIPAFIPLKINDLDIWEQGLYDDVKKYAPRLLDTT